MSGYGSEDTGGASTGTMTRTVDNIEPTADAGADQIANERSLVVVTGVGADRDGLVQGYLGHRYPVRKSYLRIPHRRELNSPRLATWKIIGNWCSD